MLNHVPKLVRQFTRDTATERLQVIHLELHHTLQLVLACQCFVMVMLALAQSIQKYQRGGSVSSE